MLNSRWRLILTSFACCLLALLAILTTRRDQRLLNYLFLQTDIYNSSSTRKKLSSNFIRGYNDFDVFNDRTQFLSKLDRFIEGSTFSHTVALLQSMEVNCSRMVTKKTEDFLSTIHLAEKLEELENHLQYILNETKKVDGLSHDRNRTGDNLKTVQKIEGNSRTFFGQLMLYVLLSHQPWVNQVCEIGFNAGHSALFWLAGNNKTKLTSFDIGMHSYSKPMSDFLHSLYPQRFNIFWGDSGITVPEFWKQNNSSFRCDIIVIDGSHQYDDALADLCNMRPGSRSPYHLLIVDDCPCLRCWHVVRAFKRAQSMGVIGKHAQCFGYPHVERGMTFGYYK